MEIKLQTAHDIANSMPTLKRLETRTLKTTIGSLILGAFGGELWLCEWADVLNNRADVLRRVQKELSNHKKETKEGKDILDLARQQLHRYMAGEVHCLDFPLHPVGTELQMKVWDALQHIPYGETITYGELARRVGRPRAVRAVAAACRANAISLFIPCHRVIAASGKMQGYAGGLDVKERLIRLETINKEI